MGKPTGFLEHHRLDDAELPAEERISSFTDFHIPLPADQRRLQASRCMDCGVPFCQSEILINGKTYGCPLANLIPEFNDSLYQGDWNTALARLLKTNNFPEFTGRVCPSLCELSCVCGINQDPLTIRANELAIIEGAFEKGLIKPRIPPQRSEKRIAVIGSGPAGLTVADSLNQRGHHVTVFEKERYLGGLLTYGVPEMKLPKAMVFRRTDLLAAEGVEFISNCEVGRDIEAEKLLSDFDATVLCCGSSQPRLMNFAGDNQCVSGLVYAADYLKASAEALLEGKPPEISAQDKKVAIIGAGDTATDCVAVALRQNCQELIQLIRRPKADYEGSGRLFFPGIDSDYQVGYGQKEAIVRFGKDPRHHERMVSELYVNEKGELTQIKTRSSTKSTSENPQGSPDKDAPDEKLHNIDLLIIASGFCGCDSKVLQAFNVAADTAGRIQTEDFRIPHTSLFAAGDMRRGQSLVVWAIAEGRKAAHAVDTYLMGYSNLR